MIKVDSRIKIGTRVILAGRSDLLEVTKIHGGWHGRNWIEVKGLSGSFQEGHIAGFTNKKKKNIDKKAL